MITLYTWPTPNGQKVQILLEELGIPYKLTAVNILSGEQFRPEFLEISPNNKIPAMTDDDAMLGDKPLSMFETGAMMLYLAEKYEKFIPSDTAGRSEVMSWLFFQCASLGPMLGQATHFRRYAKEQVEYAVERYTTEASRLYNVLERRLSDREWVAGDRFSIADMAIFPWICRSRRQGQVIDDFPALKRWLATLSLRPGVSRGMDLLKDVAREVPLDDSAHKNLFSSSSNARATKGGQ